MPFEIVWEPRGVYKRFWGFVTDAEFIRSVKAAQEDPRFDDIHYNINDYLAVEGFDVSIDNCLCCRAEHRRAVFSSPD